MITKFETTAIIVGMVISTILYFIPTLIGIKRKVEYSFKGKKISTKTILILQVLGLIISGILFIFLFPSKIMLFPLKVGSIILLQSIMFGLICMAPSEQFITENFFHKIQDVFCITMVAIGVIMSGYAVDHLYLEYEPDIRTLQYEIIDINENEFIYWNSNESEENKILISEEVEVRLTDKQEPYVEMIITTNKKQEKYAKDNDVTENTSEKYIIYVPIPE